MLQNTLVQLSESTKAKLVFKDREFTAQQLTARVQSLLPLLAKKQASQPGFIALCLPNSPELLCWHLACFYLGIPIVPIIYEQTPEFIQQVLKLTEASVFITTTEKQKSFSQWDSTLNCTLEINDDEDQLVAAHPVDQKLIFPPSKAKSEQLAMIIFSSGTSGAIKGIEHSYQSAYGFMNTLIDILNIKDNLTYLVAQPMGHIGGISTTLITLLHEGAAILLQKFTINEYMAAMERYQPTHINLHTPLYYEIINFPKVNKKAFARAITCFAGGDTIPADLASQFTQVTGAPMQIGYGMTEIGIVLINRHPYGAYSSSCGKKISHAEITLKDPYGQEAPKGTTGELWVKSPGCCLGYWQMPKLNTQIFSDGWFKTNDLARQDQEGYFWYMGRDSQIIQCGEHAVYPETIEQALFDYPLINAAAVVGVKNGSAAEIPVAFVALKSGRKSLSLEKDIAEFLGKKLQSWEMPKKIIILDKLPLNLTGKIDRAQLKQRPFDFI